MCVCAVLFALVAEDLKWIACSTSCTIIFRDCKTRKFFHQSSFNAAWIPFLVGLFSRGAYFQGCFSVYVHMCSSKTFQYKIIEWNISQDGFEFCFTWIGVWRVRLCIKVLNVNRLGLAGDLRKWLIASKDQVIGELSSTLREVRDILTIAYAEMTC